MKTKSSNHKIMPDLRFCPLDRLGLTILMGWFSDTELSRRISPPMEQWFQYVTAEEGNFAWLVYEDNLPVGMIQLDTDPDKTGSISLAVNPRLRAHGYGKRILSAFLRQDAVQGLDKIEACIEVDNPASLRCVQSAGFGAPNPKPDSHGLVTYVHP